MTFVLNFPYLKRLISLKMMSPALLCRPRSYSCLSYGILYFCSLKTNFRNLRVANSIRCTLHVFSKCLSCERRISFAQLYNTINYSVLSFTSEFSRSELEGVLTGGNHIINANVVNNFDVRIFKVLMIVQFER